MEEIYKDIPGYEGSYQVSNMGNVKSLKLGKERVLKPGVTTTGYLTVALCIDNKQKTFKVHQLVTIAFLGHKPNGYETVVNHIDNNPLNNRLDNLELVSNRYNSSCHKTDVGIYWNKKANKWRSSIKIAGKTINLGNFINKQDALDAYQKALNELNGL
jgi:hypothetical protein